MINVKTITGEGNTFPRNYIISCNLNCKQVLFPYL